MVRPRRRRARFARAVAAPARRAARARPRARPPALPLPVGGARPARRARCSSCRRSFPYFDLSLQHAAPGLLRRMKRWGSGDRFRDDDRRHPRRRSPTPRSARRSSSAFPGETEVRSRRAARVPRRRAPRLGRLLRVLERRRHRRPRRWTARSPTTLVRERLRECAEVQDPITDRVARSRSSGDEVEVLVDGVDDDGVLVGRTLPRGARDRRRRPARRRRGDAVRPARARS